jgi:hypothetical protein
MPFIYKELPKASKGEPNEVWAEHFANALLLRQYAKNLPDFTDRAKASEELDIAERTMLAATRRDGFDATTAARLAQVARAASKPVLAARVRPVLVEQAPKLPTKTRITMRGSKRKVSVPTSAWPTMRTKGGVPFGLIG